MIREWRGLFDNGDLIYYDAGSKNYKKQFKYFQACNMADGQPV